MRKILIIVSFSVLALCCKKDAADQASQLLSKSWKITGLDVLTNLGGTPLEGYSTNWYDSSGCRFKQTWTFNPDGSLRIEDAPACYIPDAEHFATGTWKLSDNNSKIDIVVGWYGNFNYSIVNLTNNALTVQRNEITGIGGSDTLHLLMQYQFTAQ